VTGGAVAVAAADLAEMIVASVAERKATGLASVPTVVEAVEAVVVAALDLLHAEGVLVPLSLEVSSSQQQALALPFAIPFSSSKGPLSIQVGLEVPASFAFEVQVEVPHSRQEEALEVEVWFEVPQVSFAFARQEEGQVCFS